MQWGKRNIVGNMVVQDMEKKNSQRLSAMEKRLEDVLKSNLHLQSMLQTVLKSVSPDTLREGGHCPQNERPGDEDPSGNDRNRIFPGVGNSSGLVSSEGWWDNVCKSSDEAEEVREVVYKGGTSMSKSQDKVRCCRLLYRNVMCNESIYQSVANYTSASGIRQCPTHRDTVT